MGDSSCGVGNDAQGPSLCHRVAIRGAGNSSGCNYMLLIFGCLKHLLQRIVASIEDIVSWIVAIEAHVQCIDTTLVVLESWVVA